MSAAVLLLHDLPDGSHHFDWMIQRPGGPARPLVTFRVQRRIDWGLPSPFEALRLPDHRAAYLTFQGPVADSRGSVTRLATGDLAIEADSPDSFRARGSLGAASGTFEGSRTAGNHWSFSFTPDLTP